MRQILHIFRKDARHHWPEILVCWAVVATYIWDQPRKWSSQTTGIRFIDGLLNAVPALLILSWVFLVARLVQGESLVGDRQFWITRPYVWHKLLAAKLLSVVLFIHIPLLIGQIVLLRLAHFPALPSLPGLIEIHLMFVVILMSGALTIAVVTSGIGQAALVLLLVFVFMLGMAGIDSLIPNSGASDDGEPIQTILYLSCCITVTLTQYISRKTLFSRLFIIGTAVLGTFVLVLAPYEAMFRSDFPAPTKDHSLPAKFTLDRTLSFAHEGRQPSKWREDEISLELPFQVADLSANSVVQIQKIRLDVVLPNGQNWTSHWHSLSNVVFDGRTRTWPSISIDTKFYNSIKDTPVRAKVFLGIRSFRLSTPNSVVVSGDRIGLPGNSQCVDNLTEDWLQCFSPLRRPKPIFIVAQLPNPDCRVSREATAEEPWADSPATYYDLESNSGPDFDLSPVQNFSIGLSKFYIYEDLSIRLPVCSGTRLLVSKPEFQYALRDEIDLGEITLANYHPTYPRKIIPPLKRPPSSSPPDTLSSSLFPAITGWEF